MSKAVLFVAGASGSVGSATVTRLSELYGGKVAIRAGVRSPEKVRDTLARLPGVEVVQATMGTPELESKLAGVDCLYVNTPGVLHRSRITIETLEAAERAGVRHVVVASVYSSGTDTIFGRQFDLIEKATQQLSINWTILRLAGFLDNYWGFRSSIKSDSTIYNMVAPDAPQTHVLVADIGTATARVMMDAEKYRGRTLNIHGERHTHNDVAKGFSDALRRPIKYVRVPAESTKKAYMDHGLPEWNADAVLELNDMVSSSVPCCSLEGDFEAITGTRPTSLAAFIHSIAPAFQ